MCSLWANESLRREKGRILGRMLGMSVQANRDTGRRKGEKFWNSDEQATGKMGECGDQVH